MAEQSDKRKPQRGKEPPLKRGWTTGACATAALSAAYQALLTGEFPDPVTITLPKGQEPSFPLKQAALNGNRATASIIKDAGDDPDVTHGAEIVVTVELTHDTITFHAGDGVGTVTRPGLALDVGEPAINPGPRAMMQGVIEGLVKKFDGNKKPGAAITISIPGGEKLAAKTLNGRLGIEGGLSVLGTTGIVIPYSCSAWIHSIHRGIDVALAEGHIHLAAATGSTSEAAVKKATGLADQALIDMGDFAGGMLKYLRKHPAKKLTLAGGIGKMSKLAQGAMDLHSSKSRVDMKGLAAILADLGADAGAVKNAEAANTAGEVLDMARAQNLPLGDVIAQRARETALATLSGGTEVDVIIFDRDGNMAGHSG
ncbi:MAG: cobalt-precorrin-5B (C(1))-methyltransferase [Proteobacteria bacterium]|nr:cobalt-precorrin-5B (C(1))-methyltransferase [Pseudomonadota bacterium]MDA1022046.1 cobalt-precorrin-5B (C(1))-methyltransferase [Pseudomonadota bacterium]